MIDLKNCKTWKWHYFISCYCGLKHFFVYCFYYMLQARVSQTNRYVEKLRLSYKYMYIYCIQRKIYTVYEGINLLVVLICFECISLFYTDEVHQFLVLYTALVSITYLLVWGKSCWSYLVTACTIKCWLHKICQHLQSHFLH